MPRGYFDDDVSNSKLGQTLVDNSELAVRLGSVNVTHRTGNVIYIESFKEGINSWYPVHAANDDIAVRYNKGLHGTNALSIKPTNSVGGNSSVFKLLPLLDTNNVGYELSLDFETISVIPNYKVVLQVSIFNGTTVSVGVVNLYPKLAKLTLQDYTGGGNVEQNIDVSLPKMIPHGNFSQYNFVKVIIDFNTGKYVRIYLNHNVYDVSMYGLFNAADTDPAAVYVYTTIYSDGNQEYVNMTDVIVTINEP
jgi:hypothetical protein